MFRPQTFDGGNFDLTIFRQLTETLLSAIHAKWEFPDEFYPTGRARALEREGGGGGEFDPSKGLIVRRAFTFTISVNLPFAFLNSIKWIAIIYTADNGVLYLKEVKKYGRGF